MTEVLRRCREEVHEGERRRPERGPEKRLREEVCEGGHERGPEKGHQRRSSEVIREGRDRRSSKQVMSCPEKIMGEQVTTEVMRRCREVLRDRLKNS